MNSFARAIFFKMQFFGPIFWGAPRKTIPAENCLKYVEKLCGSEPFQHFSRCDRNQCVNPTALIVMHSEVMHLEL